MTNRTALVALAALMACAPTESPQTAGREGDLGVTILSDVIYGHKLGMALTLDVFEPASPNGAGVVLVNSGGWVSPRCTFQETVDGASRLLTYDEVEERSPLCGEFGPQQLLEGGFTVFLVRHGSAPRFLIPEVVSDMRRAIRYVRVHASEYGVDPERLGIWGGSAGGHLALMLGLGGGVGDPGATDAVDAASGRVASVVAYFPATDLQELATPEMVGLFPALDFDPAQYAEYSPIHLASPDDPPTLIIHGDRDSLVPFQQGEEMYRALHDVGVDADLITMEGADHGFVGADAELARRKTVEWFQQHLLG